MKFAVGRSQLTQHSRRAFALLSFLSASLLTPTASQAQISEWLTTPDRTALVARQPARLNFAPEQDAGERPAIVVDDRQAMQTMDGFGFALTGGSAQLLMQMTPGKRNALLQEIFGSGEKAAGNAIGVSYLRVSIGSSDMNDHVFTYDDLPDGDTDADLRHFSLGEDLKDVVPVLQAILKIDPSIKILGTPWSAPSWMKTNGKPKGGNLKPELYPVYAHYLARYVQEMGRKGIRIDAITPQNEPLNPNNTPSMVMTAEQEDAFIRQALGPVFRKEGLRTKIIVYDHNCDRPDYPATILSDKAAAAYVDGSGFHLYGGVTEAMTEVHDAYPQKNIYFTEQMVVDEPQHGPDLRIARPLQEIVIGATRNWSRNVLLWNLAADPKFGPHTSDGGCPVCEGAITLDGDTVTRNLGYYTIAQVSKFVRPGAARITSMSIYDAPASVAFREAGGRVVLVVANPSETEKSFEIRFHGQAAMASLPAGAAATFVW